MSFFYYKKTIYLKYDYNKCYTKFEHNKNDWIGYSFIFYIKCNSIMCSGKLLRI